MTHWGTLCICLYVLVERVRWEMRAALKPTEKCVMMTGWLMSKTGACHLLLFQLTSLNIQRGSTACMITFKDIMCLLYPLMTMYRQGSNGILATSACAQRIAAHASAPSRSVANCEEDCLPELVLVQ